jgi:hypothetical protein
MYVSFNIEMETGEMAKGGKMKKSMMAAHWTRFEHVL